MITFTRPTDRLLQQLADELADRPLSYQHQLLDELDSTSRRRSIGQRWFVDRYAAVIGHGPDDFAAAEVALHDWAMFEQGWTVPVRPSVPIKAGQSVTYGARVLGLWWSYGCRIIEVVNEPNRFGFVYGTIAGHAERGEERFQVELHDNGDVVFSLHAASRPGQWFAWPGLFIARRAQRRFRPGAAAAMRRAVADHAAPQPSGGQARRVPANEGPHAPASGEVSCSAISNG